MLGQHVKPRSRSPYEHLWPSLRVVSALKNLATGFFSTKLQYHLELGL